MTLRILTVIRPSAAVAVSATLFWTSLAQASISGGFYLAAANFSKTSKDGAVSAMLPAGFSGTASIFVSTKFCVGAGAELNMEMAQKSVVFLGGEAFAGYYLAGGNPLSIEENLFTFNSSPRFNFYLFAGMGQRTFNFKTFEATTTTAIRRKAPDNLSEGSFFAPVGGAGMDFPMSRSTSLSLRVKVVNGFGNTYMPAIRIMSAMLGMGVAL